MTRGPGLSHPYEVFQLINPTGSSRAHRWLDSPNPIRSAVVGLQLCGVLFSLPKRVAQPYTFFFRVAPGWFWRHIPSRNDPLPIFFHYNRLLEVLESSSSKYIRTEGIPLCT
jgi:hypothetical protein